MENNLQPNVPIPAPHGTPPLPAFPYGKDGEPHQRLCDYWNILLKRKWWVLGIFLGVVITVGLITFLMTPVYRSSTTLQIIQDNPSAIIGERDPLSILAGQDTLSRFYETQYMILNSRPMAYRIIDSLNLKEHPEYQVVKEKYPEKSEQEIDSLFADQLLKRLEIKPLKKSYLVEISFKSKDKHLAQQLPNALYNEYIKFSMTTRQQSYALIREWLERELQQFATKVEASEKKVFEHGQKKDFLSLEGKENVITKKYIELNNLLTRAQSERTIKEAQYQQIKEKGVDAPLITNNLLIQKLREETISQEAKVSSINKIYDVNFPQLQAEQAKLRELRASLKQEVNRIRASVEADYQAAWRAENLLRESLESQKNNVIDLQNNLVQHHILKRDLQTNEQLYQALLARMKEASVASTMVTSNVAVIAPAELPLKPYSPRKLLNLAVAALMGLMGGVGMAFLVEYLDDSIKTAEELERVCRFPVLGVVPLLSQNNKGERLPKERELELAAFKEPKSLVAEAIYHVRTSVMLSLSGRPPGALMITSANPSEGKTTLSINLASSIAMNNRQVVLIDADLRKPMLHSILQQNIQPGLSNFLTGNATAADIVRPTFIPNLFFIPAGTIPPNPMQLLSSQTFIDLLKDLRQDFQHLLLDTPPIIGFADGRAISTLVDGVLLVFRHHSTSREAGRLAMQLLMQVNAQIIGGILNMAESDKLGYGGYYGYYKHYSKYYNKYLEK